ncbi:MazG nucleotide pyrophosphohydrolase domain-containing protein [Hazenella coriacea]|uniref:NTP pyrophosphatase (Non-canonical NTP hydrolase) n=1 Tax=Hazenella coriacea TaxID=1179467 RepID=A0A4R3L6J5_9BACL|nr:MazG-like family protein [Hazenella coriacea]TCS95042.1 NTP pyrophosphatase (non-canonical NTP hydrolase) [Hazenella coriacea]
MNLSELQSWVEETYQKRGWTDYGPFVRVGFLMEEVGELAQAVRAIEIGRDRPDEQARSEEELLGHLMEELGDVIGNIAILANKYDLSLDDVIQKHQEKLLNRYKKDESGSCSV